MPPRGSTVATGAEVILVEQMVDTVLGVVYGPIGIVETAGQVADVVPHRLSPWHQLSEATAVADTLGVGVRATVASLVCWAQVCDTANQASREVSR